MPPASTLASGRDVYQESLAGAEVAHDHGAEVIDRGPRGTRPAAIDPRSRTRPSQATALVFVSEAGPCGEWRYRDLTKTGSAGWGVAPALLPPQAGDGVHTERRDAGPLARLRRSGELTPVEVPAGDDDASHDLSRAGEEARGDLSDVTDLIGDVLSVCRFGQTRGRGTGRVPRRRERRD